MERADKVRESRTKTSRSLDPDVEAILAAYPNRQSGDTCSVKRSGQAELAEALYARGLRPVNIARALRDRGSNVSDGMMQRHFRRDCQCKKP